MQYYESKFGKDMVRNMIPRMKDVAREYGIQMEYGGCVGNTLDSHVSCRILMSKMYETESPCTNIYLTIVNDSPTLLIALDMESTPGKRERASERNPLPC